MSNHAPFGYVVAENAVIELRAELALKYDGLLVCRGSWAD
jgi:hypothetical protein